MRFAGPTIFSGYLNSDGAEFDELGYYRTGDIFEIAIPTATSNCFAFVDRAKDIIIRGGMNVSAAEVEALASAHDAVAECAVVAYPDEDLGERVGIFVVAAEDAEPTLERCDRPSSGTEDRQLQTPRTASKSSTALPRNPVGKIVKTDLRRRWLR